MFLTSEMKVGVLPRAPLPGGVKVARRPVKPLGVGASPTLAAILGRQADTSWLHLSRKQDRHRRGRRVTDAFRHRPVAQAQSARLITGRRRSVTCRDDHFPTGWCSQSARLVESQEVSAQFRLQWPVSKPVPRERGRIRLRQRYGGPKGNHEHPDGNRGAPFRFAQMLG